MGPDACLDQVDFLVDGGITPVLSQSTKTPARLFLAVVSE